MAENVVLNNLSNLQNDTTTINTINGNNATITAAFTDVLSRTGVSPNTMGAPLDMNSWPIMNLPAPGSANSPARLMDVTGSNPIAISLSLTGDVTAPASSGVLTTTLAAAGTSGHKVPYLDGTNTFSGLQAFTNTGQTNFGGPVDVTTTANADGFKVHPASAPTHFVTIKPEITANTALIGYWLGSAFGTMNYSGTTTNDNAQVGCIGEYISSFVAQASPVSIITATQTNVTSISLTAGDWDVFGQVGFSGASTTTVNSLSGAFSTTSATMGVTSPSFFNSIYPSIQPLYNVAFNAVAFSMPTARFSLATTTTVFLVVRSDFSVSTSNAWGNIQARRVR
jgi:hypothetical protein